MSVRLIRQALMATLFVAAGALFLISFLDNRGSRSEVNVAPSPPPKFSIVQTTRPLIQGAVVHREDVEIVTTSVLLGRGTIANVSDAVNRITARNIARAEPLSDINTASSQQGNGLSELIPPGLRAVALRVNDESAVSNLIRPGDRVDVLLVSNASKTQAAGSRLFPPAEAATVLQNVLVLAVGSATLSGGSAGAIHNVTLAVTPRQAAMVALVRTVGGEYLSLRATGDDAESPAKPVLTDDLETSKLPEPRAASAPVPRQAPPPRVVEIISGKGDNVSHVRLEETK